MNLRKNTKIITFVLVLLIITAVNALFLSFVYTNTKDLIKENEKKEEFSQYKIIFPEADDFKKTDSKTEVFKNGQKIGLIIETSSKGYGGPLKILTGIKNNGQISGVSVLSHSETPGLGSKISDTKPGEIESVFLKQFRSKDKAEIDNIDFITAATISSKGVLNSVKEALKSIEN